MASSTPSTGIQAKNTTPISDSTSSSQVHHSGRSSIKVELAINVNEQNDLTRIDDLLKGKGYKLLSSDLTSKTIQLELDDKTDNGADNLQSLQKFMEKETGFLTVIKGVGDLASAVTELKPSNNSVKDGNMIHGVIRLSQLNRSVCYFDGLVGGCYTKQNTHPGSMLSLAIHEYGDLESDDYMSIGEPIITIKEESTGNSDMLIRRIIPNCDVTKFIGRSIALTQRLNDESKILSAGVVARASTVEQNKKQICSCSGKTLWEEREDKLRSAADYDKKLDS